MRLQAESDFAARRQEQHVRIAVVGVSQDVRATTITQEVISRGIYYRSSVCGQSNSCVVVAYFSASAFRSSVVTRVASAMMNAISLLVVMKRAPFLMYSTWRGR